MFFTNLQRNILSFDGMLKTHSFVQISLLACVWDDPPCSYNHASLLSFSVRSAYHMIHQKKLSREAWLYEQGGSSHSQADSEIWTKLWGINVPSKLKIFLWSLAKRVSKCLPLRKGRTLACPPCSDDARVPRFEWCSSQISIGKS